MLSTCLSLTEFQWQHDIWLCLSSPSILGQIFKAPISCFTISRRQFQWHPWSPRGVRLMSGEFWCKEAHSCVSRVPDDIFHVSFTSFMNYLLSPGFLNYHCCQSREMILNCGSFDLMLCCVWPCQPVSVQSPRRLKQFCPLRIHDSCRIFHSLILWWTLQLHD